MDPTPTAVELFIVASITSCICTCVYAIIEIMCRYFY